MLGRDVDVLTGIRFVIVQFDEPDLAPVTLQINSTSQCASFKELSELPEKPDKERRLDDTWNASVVSYQHPDHDT